MTVYTIGFTQKNAEKFFSILKTNQIDLLLDVRLNNKSQLAGFTKGEDLRFFLSEICHCDYKHCLEFAPTKEMLDSYKKNLITWDDYVEQYHALMTKRAKHLDFSERFSKYTNICLLCSEPTPERCHRRLLAELIAGTSVQPIHIRHL